MNADYKEQVRLLLDIMSVFPSDTNLVMHGGTAINMFVFDMPRLSVDIDLTYDKIEDRQTSINAIKTSLKKIKSSVEKEFPNIEVSEKVEALKLYFTSNGVMVKLEVNNLNRGLLYEAKRYVLSQSVQKEFNKNFSFNIVSKDQLFGGKVTAALDRQHPRDIFDIRTIMESIDLSEIKKGIMFFILCSGRPLDELLNPNLIDQEDVFYNAFQGMANLPFTYEDFLHFRSILISGVNKLFDDNDKAFFISFFEGNPRYDLFPIEDYPSIKWKQININKLKTDNPKKYAEQLNNLKTLFTLKLLS